ncbi:MAG: hypothetical protein VB092_04880 [Oscillospiraceae bacterium]|nr:hypothetical protein [Oscillospiraceae bacterium]
MICEKCGNELHIAASFMEAKQNEHGGVDICSVADLMCMDERCPNGRARIPVKRVRRPVRNAADADGAVSCCGAPLLYVGPDSYFLPDGISAETVNDGKELAVTCGSCGRLYIVNIEGKIARGGE